MVLSSLASITYCTVGSRGRSPSVVTAADNAWLAAGRENLKEKDCKGQGRIGKDRERLGKTEKDWEGHRRIRKDRERLERTGKDLEGQERIGKDGEESK